MKTLVIVLGAALLIAGGVHLTHGSSSGQGSMFGHFTHRPASHGEGPVTFSIRQNDFDLCEDPFYVGFFDLSVDIFGVGVEQVNVTDYQQKVFHYIRTTDTFAEGDREAFVDHVKDIPRQMVEIIREDPAVLDSCANFSVALVGPP